MDQYHHQKYMLSASIYTLSEVSNAFKSAMADDKVAKAVGTFGWTKPSTKADLLKKMESYMDGTVAILVYGCSSYNENPP